jgi:hypothetical protein
MKSPYRSKVRSSCKKPANCRDEKATGGALEPKSAGSVDGVARNRKGTPDAEASGDAIEAKRALGTEAGGAAGEGGCWRVLHRLRGRTSKRKLSAAVRANVARLLKRECPDFGPTLAAEYLGEKHGVVTTKQSVRQILMEAGVWKRKRRRMEEIHVYRVRRSCWGEME